MISLLLAVYNGDFSAEQVEDESNWHKCATPWLERMRFGDIGQTMRKRLSNGSWTYERADKIVPRIAAPSVQQADPLLNVQKPL